MIVGPPRQKRHLRASGRCEHQSCLVLEVMTWTVQKNSRPDGLGRLFPSTVAC